MINNDSNNITKWDRKSGDEVEGNLGDAGSTFTFHKKKKIKNTVTLPQIPITGYMVILRIIHATFTFAHIADMQSPVAVKSLYECQLYHLHREDEDNSHNGVGVMVGGGGQR